VGHDFGKCTTYFQDYVRGGSKYSYSEKKNHSYLSAFFTLHLVEETLGTGAHSLLAWESVLRHYSNLDKDLSFEEGGELSEKLSTVYIGKATEQLEDIIENNKQETENLYNQLGYSVSLSRFYNKLKEGELVKNLKKTFFLELDSSKLRDYYLFMMLYSILIEADKLDAGQVSIGQRRKLPAYMVQTYKEKEFGVPRTRIDRLRSESSREVLDSLNSFKLDDRLFSITLPTGLGKTLTGFDVALTLREHIEKEKKYSPRIIYSLPFLSIIEQNYEALSKVLRSSGVSPEPDTLLKHHYLSTGYLSENYVGDPSKGLLLTEGWHSEVIVTTFIQFFESLITYRNSMAKKIHSFSRSIIILDEVQSIPRRYWGVLHDALIEICYAYDSYLILMTATNPLIFDPEKEINELVSDVDSVYGKMDRVNYFFDLSPKTLESLSEEVLEYVDNNPDGSILIVLNTIKSSKQLYHRIKEKLPFDWEPVYLSTHILPGDRLERIQRIKRNPCKMCVVSTQLVEAGVDIDLDFVIRDFAPLDSIIQTAGRCNRESGSDMGTVRVVHLRDEDNNRFYCDYIYDRVLLDITREVIGDNVQLTESEFNRSSSMRYFHLCTERASTSDTIQDKLAELKFTAAKEFKLIEDYRSIQFYIELGEESEKVRRRVSEELSMVQPFERRATFLSYRKKFFDYVLNVNIPEKDLDKLTFLDVTEPFEQIYLIHQDISQRWYDHETGFMVPETTFDLRIA
jgi:CRISPR-associated endonuclease/helicase Cas3